MAEIKPHNICMVFLIGGKIQVLEKDRIKGFLYVVIFANFA